MIKNNGRASEFLLISRYSMSEPGMIKQVPFGLSMMAKGKLPLSIDRMENTRELEAIFNLGGREQKAGSKEIKEKEPQETPENEKPREENKK